MLTAITALAILGLAAAQNTTTASAYDINLIKANFQNAQLTPQLIPNFSPQGTLGVSFGGQAITIGQNLSQSAVGSNPDLSVLPSGDGSRINTNSMYTVAMVDANTVGTDQNTTAQTRHWLVNTVSLSGQPPFTVNFTGSTAITDYAGPGPASGSGSHRYVILLYAQSSAFAPPANLSTAGVGLGTFFLEQYVNSTGLGPLVAANYIQVENGIATVTVAATSAVDTATIASTTSASMVGSSSGSASKSGSASGSAASGATSASSTSKAAAAMGTIPSLNLGLGFMVGGMGVIGVLAGAALGF